MILSVWRYSHFSLALCSFSFILIAALTGIVLAFEPIQQEMESADFSMEASNTATLLANLSENYLEVFEVKVDGYNRVSVSVLTEEGNMSEFYVHPQTGEKVGELTQESPVFQFARNVHRSLFLKTTGRFFVGFSSFLLVLISVSGFLLLIKRQQGFKKVFANIISANFFQYGHVYLGRLFLIPIIIISLSGVYLSLFQFNVLTHPIFDAQVDATKLQEAPKRSLSQFPIFKQTPLTAVKRIAFPFSAEVSDYYTLHLKDKSLAVHQFTGQVIDADQLPVTERVFQYSYRLHTGEGNVLWAFVLLLACVSLLFFIYSGFKITLKRKSAKIKNKFRLGECSHLILVGSETGTTLSFAVWFQQALQQQGKKVFVAQLNEFAYHEQLEQVIIFTATYGLGEPPANATRFEALVNNTRFSKPLDYSVLGFGSFAYPDFCKFAYTVEALLEQKTNANCFLALHTINNQSTESFNRWLAQWSSLSNVTLPKFEGENLRKKRKKRAYKVVQKTAIIPQHQSFMVKLQPVKKHRLRSGDLLAVSPGKKHHDRLYSVGITAENSLLLCVKLHENGVCSSYLNSLKKGEVLYASRLKNKAFYFPKQASKVIMVATGTGIAPFLGMLAHNKQNILTELYWGVRDRSALPPYEPMIDAAMEEGRLGVFEPVYSRMDQQHYVQNRLQENADQLVDLFQNDGVLMLCGSIYMQQAIVALLTEICEENHLKKLSDYQKRGQLLMDCY